MAPVRERTGPGSGRGSRVRAIDRPRFFLTGGVGGVFFGGQSCRPRSRPARGSTPSRVCPPAPGWCPQGVVLEDTSVRRSGWRTAATSRLRRSDLVRVPQRWTVALRGADRGGPRKSPSAPNRTGNTPGGVSKRSATLERTGDSRVARDRAPGGARDVERKVVRGQRLEPSTRWPVTTRSRLSQFRDRAPGDGEAPPDHRPSHTACA